MAITNHTPFPAVRYDNVDQHGRLFEVLVLRQTLSFSSGTLAYADVQQALSESDTFFGAPNASSVLQESDLCFHKPRCDVIVNATAHAPGGLAVRRFNVRLIVRQPDTAATLPPKPQGLNQFEPAPPAVLARWEQEISRLQRTPVPGRLLIDKILVVHGDREFKKKRWWTRVTLLGVYFATLTIFRPTAWKLSKAQTFTSLPLRHEYAYGGQYRIPQGDPAASRVPSEHRLTPEERAARPDLAAAAELQASAHTAFDPNPIGRGYTIAWALKLHRTKVVPAPRIEIAEKQITAKQFARWLQAGAVDIDRPGERSSWITVAGFGIRCKTHPLRSRLLGTVDTAFVQSTAPLPRDFDTHYWNAAPPDQQIDFPRGDESIELINLCKRDTPTATVAPNGDTCLRLTLPGNECFLSCRSQDGRYCNVPMQIDTIIVEPEQQMLSLVWRATFVKPDEDIHYDLRLRTNDQRDGASNTMGSSGLHAAAADAS